MKLDVNVLRYMTKDEFRVLTAVEMGMRNHEIVPSDLIERIAGLKRGGAFKNLKMLLRHKLVHHDSSNNYDGYRLTNLGYDFLAIKTLCNRGIIAGVGRQIGVGKESDIFEVLNEEGETLVMKLHRLGRTSFRAVKQKRDYLRHRSSFNWLYLSRLSALKEFAFMKALGEHGFPVPRAIDCNRHCVIMGFVPGFPLVQVKELKEPGKVFSAMVDLVVRLAKRGLIHCDFNEFNVLVDDDQHVTMIDFPQMVSTSHRNAKMYYERDLQCIRRFFRKRFQYSPEEEHDSEGEEEQHGLQRSGLPLFAEVAGTGETLDRELAASGFTSAFQEDLDQALEADREAGDDGVEELQSAESSPESDTTSDHSEDSPDALRLDKNEGHREEESEAVCSNFEDLTIGRANEVEGTSRADLEEGEESSDVGRSSEAGSDEDKTSRSEPQGLSANARKGHRRLMALKRKAAAAVKVGGGRKGSRNATKDRGGRRGGTKSGGGGLDF